MRPPAALLPTLIAPILIVLPLAACLPAGAALHDATLSSAPGAPGYLIVGLAEQNYRWDLATWTQSVTLTLTSPGQPPITVVRRGCGALGGLVGDKPCDLSHVDRVVLQVAPGTWTPTGVTEAYHLTDGDHTLQAALPAAPLTVAPGRITYAGDYVFAGNADIQSIQLASHSRNDAAAQRALAPFTHLRTAPMTYAGSSVAP